MVASTSLAAKPGQRLDSYLGGLTQHMSSQDGRECAEEGDGKPRVQAALWARASALLALVLAVGVGLMLLSDSSHQRQMAVLPPQTIQRVQWSSAKPFE